MLLNKNNPGHLRIIYSLQMAGAVIAIKLLVVVYGIQAYLVSTDKPINSFYRVLYIWKRWDAVHYLNLAQNGYTDIGDDRFLLVFYPLYPLVVAGFTLLVGDTVLSAFLVSGISSLVLALVLRELVRLDFSERIAQSTVIFLFIFPTSFVLHIPYTESLFLALIVSTFLAARKQNWLLVGILGFFACTTRINGLVLFPALLFEVWREYKETQKLNPRWMFMLLIPIGVFSYLGLNYYVSGDAFKFLQYQGEHWHRYLRFPWQGLRDAVLSMLGRSPSMGLMVGFQELLFVGIGVFGIYHSIRKLRASYSVWMITNWLLFVSSSFVLSVTRYTIVLFPLFIIFAIIASNNKMFKIVLTVWSILFLAFFAGEFVRGHWTF